MSKPTIKFAGVTVPDGLTRKELFKFLVANKAAMIAEKKSAVKHADTVCVDADINTRLIIDKDGNLLKADAGYNPDMSAIETVLCVINTTNWMDSHSDVHIPGLWDKSIKERKIFTHLQEHKMAFTHIICDNAKGYTQKFNWKDLGLESAGVTEALIFASPLTGRNTYMEDLYRKGWVKNHSVGMAYVIIKMCINEPEDEWYKEEYANWVQYIGQVVNKEKAEEQGFFWAVLEAKIIEGSAVPIGSNIITPTIGFKTVEPVKTTQQNEPPEGTQVKDEKPTEGLQWDRMAKAIESLF